MKTSFQKQITAMVTAWTMLVAPILPAYADTLDYNTVCSPSVLAAASSGSGDQTKAYCTQAQTSQTAVKFQTMKELLMFASGATLTALAFMPLGQGGACKIISTTTDIAGLGLDVTQAIKTSSLSSAMMTGMSSLGAIAITNEIKNGVMKSASSAIGNVIPKKANSDCIVDAGLSFAQGAVSMMSVSMAKKAEQSALSSAKSLQTASGGTSTFSLGGNTPTTTGSSGTAAGATAKDPVADNASCVSGDTTACLAKADPVSAAITSNPDLMNGMQQALGKPVNDFLQGYKGDGSAGSMAGYVGGGLGFTPDGIAALKKTMETAQKVAEDKGYTPATYVASNNSSAAAPAADVDFSKMMSGMMKQLAPDAKIGEDPSDIVFRQLDLLPASKIEANKEISLFARIGYRYRKKSGEVEQLNWSVPNNQTVNNTPIDSSLRTPASKN